MFTTQMRRPSNPEHQESPDPVLQVEGLTKHYSVRNGPLGREVGTVRALEDVSFSLKSGQTLAIVGESGCGKSTLARTLLRLHEPTAGRIIIQGQDVTKLHAGALRVLRKRIQMVFQDPYSSLNPRLTVRQSVTEPLRINHMLNARNRRRVDEVLELVGLSTKDADRLVTQFSGGQRQRVAIARALAMNPDVIILDEPVAALDVSIQAQVINLLNDIQKETGIAYLFISHDLAVVRQMADSVASMYLGRIVETGNADLFYGQPHHPYTVALMSAVPTIEGQGPKGGKRIVLRGEVPSSISPPSGCPFRTRCWKAREVCATTRPLLLPMSGSHRAACHFPENQGSEGNH